MSPGVVVAFHADIILARHAILANKRPLKRAVKNIDQSHHTSRSGKCAFAVRGKERVTKPKGRLRGRLGQWWVLY